MNFCVNCRHARGDGDAYDLECDSPQNGMYSIDHVRLLVTGIKQPVVRVQRSKMCRVLRAEWPKEVMPTICGPDGKWFEEN